MTRPRGVQGGRGGEEDQQVITARADRDAQQVPAFQHLPLGGGELLEPRRDLLVRGGGHNDRSLAGEQV
jgi:hypothetical protein